MKERFLNVVKWFFIILGVLFFSQIVFLICLIILAKSAVTFDLTEYKFTNNNNTKEFQKLIDKAEEYKKENGKYPEKIENIELKKDLEYTYAPFEDFNCFKIEVKNTKNNSKKEYQRCDIQKDGMSSFSENYSEEK